MQMPRSSCARFGALSLLVVSTAAPLARGQGATTLWVDNCAKCHGDRGQGGGAGTRSLLDDKYLGVDRMTFDKSFFETIKNGKKDEDGGSEGMDSFGLTMTDQQIWSLVVHIRELQEQDRRKRGGIGTLKKPVGGVYSTQHYSFKVETVADNLDVPWSVAFLPDGKMLITERNGPVRVHSTGMPGGTLSEPIVGTPKVYARGQAGMMDVAVHPEFATNGWVYLSFSDPLDGKALTKIVRGKLKSTSQDAWTWTDEHTIWQAKPEHYLKGDIHFGSRIVFSEPNADPADKSGAATKKRYVYFCMGERGRGELAQDVTRPNGKVYRLWDDGTVPSDNPFVSTPDAYPAIYSFGHRNPQGLVLDLNGNLWDTEHGPRGGDELNLIKKGANYGWPIITFGINYSDAPLKTPWPTSEQKFEMPTWVWLPSIAACGLDVVRPGPKGELFPKWKGDFFAGGLAGEVVERLRVKDGKVIEREDIVHRMGRVRDVVSGPDGSLYVVLNDPNKVVRLTPTDVQPAK